MNRGLKIAAVSVGLLAGGALFGAIAAVIALFVGVAVTGHLGEVLRGEWLPMLVIAGGVGAFFGGILLPVTGFTLLRRVPLGLTAVGTVLGTIVGGAAGWALSALLHWDQLNPPIAGAVLGFFASALLLRRIVAGRQRAGVMREPVAVRARSAPQG
jgi:hypothetical protein